LAIFGTKVAEFEQGNAKPKCYVQNIKKKQIRESREKMRRAFEQATKVKKKNPRKLKTN
jgi:hypothetical protein